MAWVLARAGDSVDSAHWGGGCGNSWGMRGESVAHGRKWAWRSPAGLCFGGRDVGRTIKRPGGTLDEDRQRAARRRCVPAWPLEGPSLWALLFQGGMGSRRVVAGETGTGEAGEVNRQRDQGCIHPGDAARSDWKKSTDSIGAGLTRETMIDPLPHYDFRPHRPTHAPPPNRDRPHIAGGPLFAAFIFSAVSRIFSGALPFFPCLAASWRLTPCLAP